MELCCWICLVLFTFDRTNQHSELSNLLHMTKPNQIYSEKISYTQKKHSLLVKLCMFERLMSTYGVFGPVRVRANAY